MVCCFGSDNERHFDSDAFSHANNAIVIWSGRALNTNELCCIARPQENLGRTSVSFAWPRAKSCLSSSRLVPPKTCLALLRVLWRMCLFGSNFGNPACGQQSQTGYLCFSNMVHSPGVGQATTRGGDESPTHNAKGRVGWWFTSIKGVTQPAPRLNAMFLLSFCSSGLSVAWRWRERYQFVQKIWCLLVSLWLKDLESAWRKTCAKSAWKFKTVYLKDKVLCNQVMFDQKMVNL